MTPRTPVLIAVAAVSAFSFIGPSPTGTAEATEAKPPAAGSRSKYRVDMTKSRFIVETQTSGLAAMFAHDHKMEVGDFAGTATFTAGALATGASLQMTVKAESLHLVDEASVGARQSVESALRQEVLETDKYPEIAFKTSAVTSSLRGDGSYGVRLTGDLSLHGVRRRITVPARVSLQDDDLHAIGTFDVRQTDFNITPSSFVSGTVTIKDEVTISFDIVAHRI